MSSDTQKGRPPELTSLTVSKIVRNLFCFCDVNTQSVKELPSYVDRNFYFCGTPEASVKNQHEDPGEQAQSEEREYVLKVHNPLLFSCAILGGINTLLDYLQSKGIAECIHPLRSRQGKTVLEITGEDLACYETDTNLKLKTTKDFKEIKYLIVLVTFIPGESLDQIEKSHLTPKLLYDIGNLVGKVDSVLHLGFEDSHLEKRDLSAWDFRQLPAIRTLLLQHDNIPQRKMVEKVLDEFKQHVSPHIPKFHKGIMHGDTSAQNIIVRRIHAGEHYVAGIIDFGHAISSCYAFDLGILLATIMIECLDEDITVTPGPVEFVGPALKGYIDTFPLALDEVRSLYYIVMMRLCQSALTGTYNFKQEPWNKYFLITPSKCWKLLELMLMKYSKEEVDRIWYDAIQSNSIIH